MSLWHHPQEGGVGKAETGIEVCLLRGDVQNLYQMACDSVGKIDVTWNKFMEDQVGYRVSFVVPHEWPALLTYCCLSSARQKQLMKLEIKLIALKKKRFEVLSDSKNRLEMKSKD